ncbi:hypothetical protein WAK64_04390 [Bacillus spongiae]|uniref:DUF3139 domain-containing protein n=1 Tax=Bacillus spongiae TaxID=2683610 RepID=A0ABU8HAD3_9BACI
MKKKKRLFKVGLLALIAIIILPPILAPLVHDNDSPRSALRESILKAGHPYQSFFALITKGDYKDKDYGQRYNVYWIDYDSLTGDTATICYTKERESEKYEVSCGTGP